jgi:hypothetical protein
MSRPGRIAMMPPAAGLEKTGDALRITLEAR